MTSARSSRVALAPAAQMRSAAARFMAWICVLCTPWRRLVMASTSAHTWNRNSRTPSCTGRASSMRRSSIVYWITRVSRCSTCSASETAVRAASLCSRMNFSMNFSNSVSTVWKTRRPVSG